MIVAPLALMSMCATAWNFTVERSEPEAVMIPTRPYLERAASEAAAVLARVQWASGACKLASLQVSGWGFARPE